MAELKGLHVVVPAELLDATYDKAASEGKTLSEAVTDLLTGYTSPKRPKRPAAKKDA